MAEEDEFGGVVAGGDDQDGQDADEWVAWGVEAADPVAGAEESVQSKPLKLVAQAEPPELSEEEEQEIRDHFGYSKSETRTKAERDSAAERIVAGLPSPELPEDILEVWGDSQVAKTCVDAWGVEVFRGSELHRRAIMELGRQARLAPAQRKFWEQRK